MINFIQILISVATRKEAELRSKMYHYMGISNEIQLQCGESTLTRNEATLVKRYQSLLLS